MANTPPRPQAPEAPLPTDCCGSGCAVCVLDSYADELAAYKRALADWEAKYQGSDAEPPSHEGGS